MGVTSSYIKMHQWFCTLLPALSGPPLPLVYSTYKLALSLLHAMHQLACLVRKLQNGGGAGNLSIPTCCLVDFTASWPLH